MTRSSQLCSVAQLKALIERGETSILDSSWYLPSKSIDTEGQFKQQHIPGAQFFHIDLICDHDSDLPHMLPSAEDFSQALGALGICNDSQVVVYDSAGLFSAARVWWMFKVFGHQNVSILDGGLPAWIEQGGALENVVRTVTTSNYSAMLSRQAIISKLELIENISSKQYSVLDARSRARFLGEAPEPRVGLPSGHMPESVCMSFDTLIDSGRLKSRPQLHALFSQAGLKPDTPLVTSCGSGVTAAIITLALVECGFGLNRLYDGSWSEWGSADDTEILNRSF
ncbi:MAG: thiosulfate/3-mercaptopyruvate sulfurtransferase [Arenicella sp.]|jgi:thiosulfate/3-mercaptopyruvate sulfurtransferase